MTPGRPRTVSMRLVEAEADEMCNFVKQKANKRWLWLAMDRATRQIIAFHVRDRSRDSASQLWANLPVGYREEATFYTDQYEVYKGVIPAERHGAITKKARKTNYIERFNNTLRPRVSRLVRETLAFSKKLANHIGTIRYFIGHYNLTRATALPEFIPLLTVESRYGSWRLPRTLRSRQRAAPNGQPTGDTSSETRRTSAPLENAAR
jgi:insertion element IS1 protein InsB